LASVFLSYSRSDEAKARKLVAALEASGHAVWWDGMLEGGERFADRIATALNSAEAVVVLWSASSIGSHWVQDEAAHGRDRGILVPVTIDGSEPPLGFRQFQAIALTRWKGPLNPSAFVNLSRAIDRVGRGENPASSTPVPVRSGASRRRLLIGGGAALAVGSLGVGGWRAGLFNTGTEGNSVVVLPFRNLSGDQAQDYFAQGLAEEIRNTLAGNPLLKVIAQATSAAFQDRSRSGRETAQSLDIAYMLDGSVRRDRDLVRISVQLFNIQSGQAQWTANFDRTFDHLLATQIEIANSVMRVLNVQSSDGGLTAEENRRATGGTANPAAFDAYMRGRNHWDRFDSDSIRTAEREFERATQIDPGYAAALANRARMLCQIGFDTPDRGASPGYFTKGLALARDAYALAPQAPYVVAAFGRTLTDNFEFAQGGIHLREAYRISNRNIDVTVLYALFAGSLRQFAQARAAIETAMTYDPLNSRIWTAQAYVNYWSGNADEAIRALARMLELSPAVGKEAWTAALEAKSHFIAGRFEKTERLLGKLDPKQRKAMNALLELKRGRSGPAQEFLVKFDQDESIGLELAIVAAQGGNSAKAMGSLSKMAAARDISLADANKEPLLEPIRKLPEFAALMKGIGLSA